MDSDSLALLNKTRIPSLISMISWLWTAPSAALELNPILENIPISKSQQHVQQNPIDYWNGNLYLTYIAPGDEGDTDGTSLHTMVSMGKPTDNNKWTWSKTLIEERTIYDVWHTAPSIGIDKSGFVHVAYNMHNLPWQYKVSAAPENITEFVFKGQEISNTQIKLLKEKNITSFPSQGQASIPGNQITYPQFVRDANEDLYVSYRFAAKPARKFDRRTMSSGIAKYDTNDKTWTAIGAPVDVSKDDYTVSSFPWFHLGPAKLPLAVASSEGWTSYFPRLSFGKNNQANINIFWRRGIAGETLTKPCFITSDDLTSWTDAYGTSLHLPITPDQCSNLGIEDNSLFYSIGNSLTNNAGEPHFILSPSSGIRKIYSFSNNKWQIQDSPYSATNIFVDAEDSIWALATGLRILRKRKGEQAWELLYEKNESTDCTPRAVLNQKSTIAFIYTTSCNTDHLNVYTIDLTKQ